MVIVLFMSQYKIKSGHGFPTGKQGESEQMMFSKVFGIRIILNLKCVKGTFSICYKLNFPLKKEMQQVLSSSIVNKF